jgi:hypothetical protein
MLELKGCKLQSSAISVINSGKILGLQNFVNVLHVA